MPPSLHAGLSITKTILSLRWRLSASAPTRRAFRACSGLKCATLIVSERRGRLTESDTATFRHGLPRLRVSVDRSPEETDVLALARYRGLTVYDAADCRVRRRD